MNIRKAAVAGYFYPNVRKALGNLVQNLILKSNEFEYIPKGIIVPHAGYTYSGPIAAHAYRLIKKISNKIKNVILIGPSHRVLVRGVAISSADYFETPLGNIKVNQELCEKIKNLPGVIVDDNAHKEEHSLEVQLPFLQETLNRDINILPAVINVASPYIVSNFLEEVWGGEETLIIVSSDLSHYLSYEIAKKKDEMTSRAIMSFDIENIHDDDACGSSALKGFLIMAKKKDLKPALLDLRNSGDTGSDKDQVVGYGAFCFI